MDAPFWLRLLTFGYATLRRAARITSSVGFRLRLGFRRENSATAGSTAFRREGARQIMD